MDSEAFLQELLAPVREFFRSLDEHPQLFFKRYATVDDRQYRGRRDAAMRMVLFCEHLASLDRWAMENGRW
jgi:hypothetical protein